MSLRCEDCGILSPRVSLCQGDLHLCHKCNKKRFGSNYGVGNCNGGGMSNASTNCDTGRESTSINGTNATSLKSPTGGSVSTLNPVIIVNELLCFLTNKMDVMPHDILLKVCADFYDDSQIENAKKELFDLCSESTTSRFKRRQGQNKKTNNIHDMLILLHEVDPNVIPTFTAYNLGNLPPLTQNHVDISVIIQQLSSIKTEIACLKESAKLSSDIHSELKTEICSIRKTQQAVQSNKTSCLNSQCPISDNSEAHEIMSQTDEDETQVLKLFVPCNPSAQSSNISPKQSLEGKYPNNITITTAENTKSAAIESDGANEKDNVENQRQSYTEQSVKSYVDAVKSKPKDPHLSTENDSFTVVSRRKQLRRRPVIGTSVISDCPILGVDRQSVTDIFISRLAPNTTSNQIITYMKSTFNIDVNYEALNTKYNSYASFRVTARGISYKEIVRPEKWPCGVLIRKYFQGRRSQL
ncbi:uncharacterized protein LOC144433018 [Glandiceps talaboti]